VANGATLAFPRGAVAGQWPRVCPINARSLHEKQADGPWPPDPLAGSCSIRWKIC